MPYLSFPGEFPNLVRYFFPDMIRPALLQPGDTVAIVSPAKAIEATRIDHARSWLEAAGFRVLTGKNAYGSHHYFSGTDTDRTADLQAAIDNPEVKAIICARGGYGCIRVTQQVNWANLLREPKWIVGFSDVTVLQQQALRLGVESIHATMPLNYTENTPEALQSMLKNLTKGTTEHHWGSCPENKPGIAQGTLIGGNLSILYSLLPTPLCPNYENAVLFIEEVGEQLYHLDRMLQSFRLSGILDRIAGLIVGGMTDMKETAVPTGWTVEELVHEHFRYRKIPIAFHAPIGHISDNRSVICGAPATLTVSEEGVSLVQ